MERTRYYIPDYVASFQCAMCSGCCRCWRINIDPQTVKKYHQMAKTDKDIQEMLNNLKRDKEGNYFIKLKSREKKVLVKNNGETKEMVLKESMVAPCLTGDGLCSIQLKHGIDALSDLCKAYPRIVFLTERGFEMALSYACPTAANTLKKKEKITFHHNPEGFNFPNLNSQYGTIGNVEKRKRINKVDYFIIEDILIKIMQNRELDLDTRIFLCGLFLKKYKDEAQVDFDSFKKDTVKYMALEPGRRLKLAPFQPLFMIKLVKKAMDKGLFLNVSDKKMEQFLKIAGTKLKLSREPVVTSEQIETFKNAYQKYYEPYIKSNSYIYENYSVNFIFSKMYYTYGYMDAYLIMMFFHVITRFFTICTCLSEQIKVDEDAVVNVINVVERSFNNTGDYYYDILSLMVNMGLVGSTIKDIAKIS